MLCDEASLRWHRPIPSATFERCLSRPDVRATQLLRIESMDPVSKTGQEVWLGLLAFVVASLQSVVVLNPWGEFRRKRLVFPTVGRWGSVRWQTSEPTGLRDIRFTHVAPPRADFNCQF